MESSYRNKIFNSYNQVHGRFLDSTDKEKYSWFERYVNLNYSPILKGGKILNGEILEIGCNKGYLLQVLSSLGCSKITGIDLCQEDVEHAKLICPSANVYCINAEEHLKNNKNRYSLIVIKAVLEHIKKDDVLQLLTLAHDSLETNGMILIDVPNMDWLFASHERYMDLTHENGFTSESILQVMRLIFSKPIVIPAESVYSNSFTKSAFRQIFRKIIMLLLKIAEPDCGDLPLFNRSIIAYGYKRE